MNDSAKRKPAMAALTPTVPGHGVHDAGDTPTRLKEAARACIAENGLTGATSRQITACAGANLASVTYHFGSKDNLVAEALIEGIRTWLTPVVEVLAGEGDPAARTLAAIQRLLRVFDEQSQFAPVYMQALAYSSVDSPLREGITSLWSDLRGLLAADILSMRQAGELGAWVDPEAMAAVLIAMANGFIIQSVIEPEHFDAGTVAAQAGSLLLAARQGR